LSAWKLPFRVVAPPTVQGATFEEHCGPNTGTVVSGKLHYIKDGSGNLSDSIIAIQMIAQNRRML